MRIVMLYSTLLLVAHNKRAAQVAACTSVVSVMMTRVKEWQQRHSLEQCRLCKDVRTARSYLQRVQRVLLPTQVNLQQQQQQAAGTAVAVAPLQEGLY
jgi:hypothetical protein